MPSKDASEAGATGRGHAWLADNTVHPTVAVWVTVTANDRDSL
jgi:hypothetical protein